MHRCYNAGVCRVECRRSKVLQQPGTAGQAGRLVACLAVAVAVAVLPSCAWFSPSGPVTDSVFTEAERQLLSENYASAIASYSRFLNDHPRSPSASDAAFGRAMAHFAQGEYSLARGDFQRCLRNPRSDAVKAIALRRLGECCMIEENFPEAEKAYRRILKEVPDAFEKDEILYRVGIACLRQAKWSEAEKYLGKVIRDYPYSSKRALAQEKMPGIDRFFSVQVGAFTSKQTAAATEKKLREKNFDAFTRTVVRSGRVFYCVRSGKFQDWKAVKHHAEVLRAAGFKELLKVP